MFARVTSEGEAWDGLFWARHVYPKMHPGAAIPDFADSLQCLHGIQIDSTDYSPSGYSMRVDYRGEGPSITLSRNGTGSITNWQFETLIDLLENSYKYVYSHIESLQNYLKAWSKLPDLTPELYPPQLRLLPEMFDLPHWQ